jgi:hypothetical protein
VDAVKIGMLHAPDIVGTPWLGPSIAYRLAPTSCWTRSMVATSGDTLIEDEGRSNAWWRSCFRARRWSRPTWTKRGLLLGRALTHVDELEAAAADLLQRGAAGGVAQRGTLARRLGDRPAGTARRACGVLDPPQRRANPESPMATVPAARCRRRSRRIWRWGRRWKRPFNPPTDGCAARSRRVPTCARGRAAGRSTTAMRPCRCGCLD